MVSLSGSSDRLQELKALYDEKNTTEKLTVHPLNKLVPGTIRQFAYGVVIHTKPVKQVVNRGDYLLTSILSDPTTNYPDGFVFLCFNPVMSALPPLRIGDVIKCCVDVQTHRGRIQLVSKGDYTAVEVVYSEVMNTDNVSIKGMNMNFKIGLCLSSWYNAIKGKPATSPTLKISTIRTQQERSASKVVKLGDLNPIECNVDICVQISAISNTPTNDTYVQLFVTDFTTSNYLQNISNIYKNDTFFPPPKNGVLVVTLWDQHCEKSASYTSGMFVKIHDLHIRPSGPKSLSAILHSGSRESKYSPKITPLSDEANILSMLELQDVHMSSLYFKTTVDKSLPLSNVERIIDQSPLVVKHRVWAKVADYMPRDFRNFCSSTCRICKKEIYTFLESKRIISHCGSPLEYEFRFALLLCDGVKDISAIVSGREAEMFLGIRPMDLYDEVNLSKLESILKPLISKPLSYIKSDPAEFGIAGYIVEINNKASRRFKLIRTKLNMC